MIRTSPEHHRTYGTRGALTTHWVGDPARGGCEDGFAYFRRRERRPRGIYSPWGESVREFCLESHLRGGRWLLRWGGGIGCGTCLLGGAPLSRNPPSVRSFRSYPLICGIVAALCLLVSHSWGQRCDCVGIVRITSSMYGGGGVFLLLPPTAVHCGPLRCSYISVDDIPSLVDFAW